MKAIMGFGAALLLLSLVLSSSGCDKERIVTSTQTVHDTKYIQLPPDTVFRVDTVSGVDTMIIRKTDTLRVNTIIHDTVIRTVNQYDTIRRVDTVTITQFQPSATSAVAAMQAKTDPMVLKFAADSLGSTGGWVFYLTPGQMTVAQSTAKAWDLFAYVDYWSQDWSGYYPLEVRWRMTYISGDPNIATNWTMADPPVAVSGRPGGVSSPVSAPSALQAMPPIREFNILK